MRKSTRTARAREFRELPHPGVLCRRVEVVVFEPAVDRHPERARDHCRLPGEQSASLEHRVDEFGTDAEDIERDHRGAVGDGLDGGGRADRDEPGSGRQRGAHGLRRDDEVRRCASHRPDEVGILIELAVGLALPLRPPEFEHDAPTRVGLGCSDQQSGDAATRIPLAGHDRLRREDEVLPARRRRSRLGCPREGQAGESEALDESLLDRQSGEFTHLTMGVQHEHVTGCAVDESLPRGGHRDPRETCRDDGRRHTCSHDTRQDPHEGPTRGEQDHVGVQFGQPCRKVVERDTPHVGQSAPGEGRALLRLTDHERRVENEQPTVDGVRS